MFSRFINWRGMDIENEWDFIGGEVMYAKGEKAIETEKNADICLDEIKENYYPMMNYAYSLDIKPTDDNIIEICENTCCTVVYNTIENRYYLALTSGGMDLSQSIAHAYLIAQDYIPIELIHIMDLKNPLSVSKHTYIKIIKKIKKQLENEMKSLNNIINEIVLKLTFYNK